ncbi:MAG: tetratricopeptide repeat protein, partial [Chitinophagaceae bacterium]
MHIPLLRVTGLMLVSALFAWQEVGAQDALAVDLKKPEKFENKKLGYEKNAEKKFTVPRRFMQNTTTHYNYYFNANNKLNEAIARVKASHKDDYSQLLPFYNYSLEKTSGEKQELDSVIFKSNTAILTHDLRNNWVDNMYMLMGKAYYYRNLLDSAYLTFQYINYAFAPKEKDGYDKVIGSNSNEDGSAFSIATKEDRGIVKKALTRAPSRNESFIWQIRTSLAKDEMPEAAGLIEILKADPNFPSRLKPELAEVQAHWFYKQNIYDSSAFYLEKALETAGDNGERARWEYLIAQLYDRSSQHALANKFYERAIKHTYDPVMEVFARLNSIRQQQSEKNNIQENINELLKMARKEKYENYRDIIYYAAAQMELERKNIPGAQALLLKSTQYSSDNAEQRNRSFLQLADLAFQQKDYQSARNYYDSVNAAGNPADLAAFNQRKEMLGFLVSPAGIIYRQDSLQRVAGMPDQEREAFVKKLVRQLRKEQGLKEDEPTAASLNNPLANQSQAAQLFTNAPKGEWYFSNASQKAKGFTEFRSKWGNRPNVDNWRRQSAINQFGVTKQLSDNKVGTSLTPGSNNTITELSYDALSSNLPLTTDKLKLSNDSLENAYMELGRAYYEKLEDHTLSVETYEKLLNRFPNTPHKQEALFNLFYSYTKLGDLTKANYYK